MSRVERQYDPVTDAFPDHGVTYDVFQERELRMRCIELAVAAAKSGASLGQSVIKVAEAYRLFSLGETPPSDPFAGLSFEQRLEALVQEFLNAEIEDARKIKHSMGEVFSRLDNAYPTFDQEHPDEVLLQEMVGDLSTSVDKFTDSIVMKHKDIRA